jgi:hypothetical protein
MELTLLEPLWNRNLYGTGTFMELEPLWNRLKKDMDVNVKAGLDQQLFHELLSRLRMGKSTLADYETLKTRVY